MHTDEAQEHDARLRWWRIHCIAVVSFVPLGIGAAILDHAGAALPLGLLLALAAYAGVKAGRSLIARDRQDDAELAFPDGEAHDGYSNASAIIMMFVGLGVAAYGGYALVRDVLSLR